MQTITENDVTTDTPNGTGFWTQQQAYITPVHVTAVVCVMGRRKIVSYH
jgi:hypothetical protein